MDPWRWKSHNIFELLLTLYNMNLFIWIRIFVLTRVFPLFMLGSAWSSGYSTFWKLKTSEDYHIFIFVYLSFILLDMYIIGSAHTLYYYIFLLSNLYYYVASWTTLLFYLLCFRCVILIFICVCDSDMILICL